MPPRPITRLRKICLALPEAHEVEAWGAPTFRLRNKMFAIFASRTKHAGRGRDGVWLKASPGEQGRMVAAAPNQFFVPPYMGPSGWVGIWLDGVVDWETVAELAREAYLLIAPKRLVESLPPRFHRD
ncbi:MAG: MmcQ/YjbR family DNA-binding protein [Pirellulales bacterium]|nr:MmcQ/YjbR family DNA-binding protein [Pirellulales bacterium]